MCEKFNNAEKNPRGHRILKYLIALALLPDHLIETALNYIEELAMDLAREQDEEAAQKAANKGTKPPKKNYVARWKKMFNYMRREWIKIVKPKNMSVFNVPERTNNVIERYHRDLNDKMGGRPGVKKFIGKCV